MTYKRKSLQILFFFMLFLLTFLSACSKNWPTYPDNLPPGSRDYTWTCDTLYTKDNPFVYIARLWGSDSANVWAVGLGGKEGVWHFNGKKWENNTNLNMSTLLAVYGFGRNNVWVGNEYGTIFRYTYATNWIQESYNKPKEYINISYSEMWGTTISEIYAVGYAADSLRSNYKILINKYNGTTWTILNAPVVRGKILYIRKQKTSNTILIVVSDNIPQHLNVRKIYSYDGKEFREIFPGDLLVALNDMDGEAYITISRRIFKYHKGVLVLWKDFRNTIYCDRIWGRNEKDFFFATLINGKYGIGHYNGENMVELFRPEPNFAVFEGLILENDVFFLGRDDFTNKSIIIHGKRRGIE